jgi:hypothetical protein
MGRAKKNPLIRGRYDLEVCATCGHKWGNHAYMSPHKCTRLDLGCDCQMFKDKTPAPESRGPDEG